ncbi:hypothetical protein [Candidatus Thiosymbion oneisti]|nr:hypothetical protein [Candidatus Thiosymbion oneisti]
MELISDPFHIYPIDASPLIFLSRSRHVGGVLKRIAPKNHG